VDNPTNPHVRRVSTREVRHLFRGCTVRLTRVTLAPPLARRLVGVSWLGALCVEKVRLFNTHCLAVVRKPRQSA
jgi:hypothetical protein